MPFILANWRLLTLIGIAAAIGAWIFTLTVQRNSAREKAENIQLVFDQFQAKVLVEGEAAKLKVAQEIAASERAKNETVSTLQGRLYLISRDRDKLRDTLASSRGSVLPAIPAGTGAANLRAAFDRAILDESLRTFIAETEGLALEGDAAAAIRDAWADWYRGQVKAGDGPR